ncbi:hypothetical protein H4696_003360 [Amycolatopsis lexingtonensis]|uniref:Uncharacterized protein n=1 Tax=Amycolatopsis lexingtonensis TaxID=218822 RepID=A0ABR9HZ96_9PSEU|nr:hypothetical protein [Amycolatopsis lexingtonensis]MBE1496260.1 hypothetical protein [Amycolatopsis lexingtonensis]
MTEQPEQVGVEPAREHLIGQDGVVLGDERHPRRVGGVLAGLASGCVGEEDDGGDEALVRLFGSGADCSAERFGFCWVAGRRCPR